MRSRIAGAPDAAECFEKLTPGDDSDELSVCRVGA
jgi:hypothetical protein